MAEVTTLKSQGRTYTLYNEDCIDGMRERLAPGLVDVVVTSPPYNLGTAYKSYDDSIGREDYVQWLGRWGAAASYLGAQKRPKTPLGRRSVPKPLGGEGAPQNSFWRGLPVFSNSLPVIITATFGGK